MYIVTFRGLLMALTLSGLLFSAAKAQEAQLTINRDDPYQMLQQTTEKVLQIAREARDYAAQDPQRYYQQVEAVLDQVVDITYFARGVMATYASVGRYRALESDAERAEFRARVERFGEALKEVLVKNYADALLTYGGERIELEKPSRNPAEADSITLMQHIYSANNEHYAVQYSLHETDSDGWRIYNVIVESINLGLVYRNQFAQAVESHQGNVDYVVNNWESLMAGKKIVTESSTQASPDGQ